MNDSNEKQRTENLALKDALVAQVWALSDEEVFREAQLLGENLDHIKQRTARMRDAATQRVGLPTAGNVVAITTAITPQAPREPLPRRRLSGRARLVASPKAPPKPQTEEPSKGDQVGVAQDEKSDDSRS